jgi:hypothetical protein
MKTSRFFFFFGFFLKSLKRKDGFSDFQEPRLYIGTCLNIIIIIIIIIET